MMHFTIEQRVDNFKLYYKKQNIRPLLGFFVGSEYPANRYEAAKSLPANTKLEPGHFDPNVYLDDCERLFELHEQAGGDFIWAASAFWGIPWLEAALGCDIYYDPETASLHSKPPENFDIDNINAFFDPSNSWIKKAGEFLDLFAKHSNGRYPLATTRMRGIADLLAALYGNESFIFKLIESPEVMNRLCDKLTDYWIEFGKYQLERIPEFYGGVGSFYYNMWVPAGTIWHQEDATALLSPQLYEQFILPCDRRIASTFGGCVMHMHPTGFYPYRQLLDTEMTALELHIDEGGPCAEDLFEIHKEILENKPLLIWGQIPEDDLDWIFSKLPAAGLAICAVVENDDQAKRIWDKYIG